MMISTGGPSRTPRELPPIEGVKAPLCERGTIGDGGGTRSRRDAAYIILVHIQQEMDQIEALADQSKDEYLDDGVQEGSGDDFCD